MKKRIRLLVHIFLLILVLFLGFYELPYYIDAPGGLDNLNNKVEVENAYKAKGSINLTYVREIKATPLMSIIALINPNWKIEPKKNPDNGNLDYDEMMLRQKILMRQSYTSAIKYAYEAAEKEVNIESEKCYVIYKYNEAKTSLKVGDQITSIDGNKIDKCSDIREYINNKEVGDKSTIRVIYNDKEYERNATYISVNDTKLIGVQLATEYVLSTNPKYKFKFSSSEYGPSGGLMVTLAVYNSLTPKDITGGKKIAGTGTIEADGSVGEIGGIEYKIIGAASKKADIFFVPSGENYEDAKKVIEKHHYKMKLVEVKSFDDALNYLLNNN